MRRGAGGPPSSLIREFVVRRQCMPPGALSRCFNMNEAFKKKKHAYCTKPTGVAKTTRPWYEGKDFANNP